MLNVGSPGAAFHLAQLPSAEVGLLRTEFMVSSWIGVHHMTLVHPERVTNEAHLTQIRELVRRAESPAEFFVERLASILHSYPNVREWSVR